MPTPAHSPTGRHRLVLLLIRGEADVDLAQDIAREMARRELLSGPSVHALASAVVEVARSMLVHAGQGEMILRSIANGPRRGVLVLAQDADVARRGLRRARQLVDEFSLTRTHGEGTSVLMKQWAQHIVH